jgi:hypothetical protein
MNLNKMTKIELINKLKSKIDSNKSEIDLNKSNIELNKNKSKERPVTIIDVIRKFQIWILSFAIITILSKIFKNYKSIRAILKVANYIILTVFGISVFEAFGFGFLIKLFGEFKYIFGSIIAYLSDSTFYNYLMKVFNVVENKESIRSSYKNLLKQIEKLNMIKQKEKEK